ncbi:MAG: glycosyltransferase family 1 protein [Patescibacteria group bacterium]|nr:glycosyltransferase family 1 protein [Patescibacteria group bacterium]MDD5490976.1 glycosyltransferase family 1 protein [Patescibacteria group bacterium]
MKIGIDARFFGPVGKGLGRYTERLIENLERLDQENQYVIFLRKENWNSYQPSNPRFKKVLADYRWYTMAEQLLMPRVIRRAQVDLMHFPHFNIPIFYNRPFVVTIHDLILYRFPTVRATTLSPLFYKIKYWVYKKVIRRAVNKAEKIFAVSEFTKQDILKHFKVPAEKIIVTYCACDGVEHGQLKMPEKKFLGECGISKPFLLYVGNAYPHKNLELLIQIFKKIKGGFNDNLQLVLVGKKDYFYERLEKGNNDPDVIFFGFAPEAILADLYRHAQLYVFPSMFEGFGLPPLEAMIYGLPVAAAKTSSLPEVLGEAAVYFDPQNLENTAEVITRALKDEGFRADLKKKGFEQIKKYSWRETAHKTLIAYNSLKNQFHG